MNLPPLPLRPKLEPRLWGGDRLLDLEGADHEDGDTPIGEAWLLGPDACVADGPHRGARLRELAAAAGERMVGRASVDRYGPVIPLLAKFLDAGAQLSIQVHPDDAYAREHHAGSGHLGKTESWLILDAEPGAVVQWGFVRPVSRAELREAIAEGRLEELVRHLPVSPGDVIHNPAGTVHGLGAGLMVYELQQASDLTYRLYDFGRTGPDGRPRELHVEHALAVADRSGAGDPRPRPGPETSGWRTLAACGHYRLERTELDGAREVPADPVGMQALTVLTGEVELAGGGVSHRLSRGGSALIPASLPSYRLEGQGTLVRGRLTEGAEPEGDGNGSGAAAEAPP